MSGLRKNLPLTLIPVFALFAPVYQALSVLRISLFHAEVAVLFAGLMLVCLVLGGLLVVARQELRVALLALITFLVIDVSIGGYDLLNFVARLAPDKSGERLLRLLAIVVVIALLYFVLWKLRRHVARILSTALGVMFASTVAFTPPPLNSVASTLSVTEGSSKSVASNLPLWIHLVFDEMAAPEAINRKLPEGQRLYERMRDSFAAYGFRLYGQAYSRHSETRGSLAALVNFDASSLEPAEKYSRSAARPFTINENVYFREFAKRGYNIHVYQTRHFNLCNSPYVARCETLNSFSPLSQFVAYPENNFFRRTANLLAMIATYNRKSNFAPIIQFLLEGPDRRGIWFDAEAFPRWFDYFSRQVLETPRGTMVFAHILAPHGPFVWGQDCEAKERVPPHYRLEKTPRLETAWPAFRVRHQQRYYEQALCVLQQLDGLLHGLEASGRLRDAVIIIHGDHGSRISRSQYAEFMSGEDLVANYAALFAIKKPEVEAGYDLSFVSLQEIFRTYASSPQAKGERRDSIVVDYAQNNAHEEAAMPRFAHP